MKPNRIAVPALCALSLTALVLASFTQSQSPAKKSTRATAPSRSAARISKTDPKAEAARLNNLGAAHMNQQKFALALKDFQQALALDPDLKEAELNQAIALVNLQRFDAARDLLLKETQAHPEDARPWYNLGLLYKSVGDSANALQAFQHSAHLKARDSDVWYFVGLMHYQLRHSGEAIAAFQRALALNRFHASAEFGLARSYQQAGQSEEAKQHLAEFQHLTQTKLGAPLSLAYGDQGPLSLAAQTENHALAPPAIPVTFKLVGAQSGINARSASAPASPSACFFDFDNDGLPDLYFGGGLYHNVGNGRFADITATSGLKNVAAAVCAAGDYDNDGRTDFALATGNQVLVYHNEGTATFKNLIAPLQLAEGTFITGLTWVDYDHDGDIDLYATTKSGKNALWRNNGNGTFTDVSTESGLDAGSQSSSAAIPTDYNNDRAIDLIVTGEKTQVFTNPREGKWEASAPWDPAMPSTSIGVAIADFNKDGWMDAAFTHATAPALTVWRNIDGKKFELLHGFPRVNWIRGWGAAALDYDNDGWIDIAALGDTPNGNSEIRLFRNLGTQGFKDVTTDVGLDKIELHNARGLFVTDYDADGDHDLLITQEDGSAILLRNDGGNKNNFVRLALQGLNDNRSAIGTKVEVFAGSLWQKLEITGAGYLGQSSTSLLVGLGNQNQADVVRLLWPTGILQDEIEVRARTTQKTVEIDRRGSSCPMLFAWDGSRYRMIADMLGAGVVGHWVAPGERNVPDPTEYLKLEDVAPRPRNGLLSFRLMEPLEEVVYLDQVRLLAIDHPVDTEVYPNEYFASNPPFPKYKVVVSQSARPPAGAWDNAGREVLDLLKTRDHRYVANLTLLPFKGFTSPHSLTLDLGEPYQGGPLRLLMRGYIEYFTATSMFAAHQAGLEPMAPYVEVLDADGKWKRVLDDMGFPAGLPRTSIADLTGKLPLGARRIRITTNLQIYWDQILVDRTSADIAVRSSEVPLAKAALGFHGFPRSIERETPGDLDYVYEEASASGPYTRPIGAYTRVGDVRNLLLQSDDHFAVFGSGDEVRLDFDASTLPPVPEHWKRDYFFFADGYEKDMDFYAANFLSVDPMPFHAMNGYPYSLQGAYLDDPDKLRYLLEYNTRFFSDHAQTPDYRFHFRGASGNQ